jgi:hypothetical protein
MIHTTIPTKSWSQTTGQLIKKPCKFEHLHRAIKFKNIFRFTLFCGVIMSEGKAYKEVRKLDSSWYRISSDPVETLKTLKELKKR